MLLYELKIIFVLYLLPILLSRSLWNLPFIVVIVPSCAL